MKLLCLPVRTDKGEALRLFRRPRWSNLFGLVRARPVKVSDDGCPASIELVWMPVYAFQFSLNQRGKTGLSWVSVDASYGGFALLGRVNEFVEEDTEGTPFPPVLDEEAARQLAREGVLKYILRKRGPKPSVNSITATKLFYSPVWVYYFKAIGGKIDLAILDGYNGEFMGGLVRRAIVDGFIAKSSSAKPRTERP